MNAVAEEPIKKKRAAKGTKTTVAKEMTTKEMTTKELTAKEKEPVTKEKEPSKSRKPRGSKIVTKQQIAVTVTTPPLTNVILNLKCSMSDLKDYNEKLSKMISNPLAYNSSAPPEVKYYDGEQAFGTFIHPDNQNKNILSNAQTEQDMTDESTRTVSSDQFSKSIAPFLSFSADELSQDNTSSTIPTSRLGKTHSIKNDIAPESYIQNGPGDCNKIDYMSSNFNNSLNIKISKNEIDEKIFNATEDTDDVNIKDMSAKLKQLKIQLYKNTLNSEKKSACFWCTYDFDNMPCYIPKYEMDGTIYGYGSFCRPECAVAYLMKETIDDSTKFDRYHLLNQIYSKVYECKKNIKPAPDPHYLLDKFYGNLTIQEYRRLLKTEHLLLVIDKPLTRILPELHEDTDDAFTKIYGIKATSGNSSGVYKVKRQSEQPQGPSKSSIIKNTFGIST